MTSLLVGAGALLFVFALSAVLSAIFRRSWHEARPHDELHWAETSDGWRLPLYRRRGELGPGRPPVVLCHGVAANRYNLDLDEEHSLAAYLNAKGARDVWLVELRGAGRSQAPKGSKRVPHCFDAHPSQDLPALLQTVARISGSAEVDWVGFSMGGLAAYAAFGSLGEERLGVKLRRLVTVGSPVMSPGVRYPRAVAWAFLLISRVPLRWISQRLAFVGPTLNLVAFGLLSVPFSSQARKLGRAMVDVVSDISRRVAGQFASWIRHERFVSLDGSLDYAQGMASIQAPARVIGGVVDQVARAAAVKAAHRLLGSSRKELVLLGRSRGQRFDYSHADLTFGKGAVAEVFPLVAEWVNGPAEPRAPVRAER